MLLPEICVRRPALAFVINAILILCGILSISYVNLQFEPTVFQPVLRIVTKYDGASASIIQKEISQKIVSALSGINNLEDIQATSRRNMSYVTLNFGNVSRTDFIAVQSDVIGDVARLRLPDNASNPEISQEESSNQIVLVGFSDKARSLGELTTYINNSITKQMEQIPGVSSVETYSSPSAVRIELNSTKLNLYNISPTTVFQALNIYNQNISAGQILTKNNAYTISIKNPIDHISKFANLIIANNNGKLIHLSQVATIKIGSATSGNPMLSTIEGKPGVILSVSQSASANPISVANAVVGYIKEISKNLPHGMKAKIVYNKATGLKTSLDIVIRTIIEAIILVSLVTLIFLGRLRSALVPIVTIPVCLIGVFIFLWPLGFSLNMMTLLAIVLAVGLVVDDAIVVLENAYRYLQKGYSPNKAAITGSNEIIFAIIGTTIVLLAVYAPLSFMKGISAVYFKEFAFTLGASVVISALVALTLSPMMCAKFLGEVSEHRYEKFVHRAFDKINNGYKSLLKIVLKLKYWVIALFLAMIFLGVFLYIQLPKTLQPNDTMGVIKMKLRGKGSTNSQYILDKAREIQKKANLKESFASSFGFVHEDDNGVVSESLKILKSNQINKAYDIANKLNKTIKKSDGVEGYAFVLPLNNNSSSSGIGSIDFYLLSLNNFNILNKQAQNIADILNGQKNIEKATVRGSREHAQFEVDINYKKAALLGVSVTNIQNSLNIFMGGVKLNSNYQFDGQDYPIILQAPKKDMRGIKSLNGFYVKSESGAEIQLSRLVDVKPTVALASLKTYNQLNAVYITVSIAPKASYGKTVDYITNLVHANYPESKVLYQGTASQLKKNNYNMTLVFLAGLIFIYLVLAALFESFSDPFIILLTVPVCVVGAMAGLYIISGSLNIYTQIGLITLVALVAKNGILIVQFANTKLKEGFSVLDSIIDGATTRLRPILMTAATMIFGALPLVYTTGIGENARKEIGVVIVSGMLIGTIFSLFIVPVAYLIIKTKFKKKIKNKA